MNDDDIVYDPEEISSLITNHFKNIFSTNNVVQELQVDQLLEDPIPDLVTDEVNNLLTRIPTPDEIHQTVLAMNKEGAPGRMVLVLVSSIYIGTS